MKDFIDIVKKDKKSKVIFIIAIGVLFVCTLSYSLSMFTNSKEGNIANIKVNGLSFNMTTNSGESDDRILKLKANTFESFSVVLTNLNSMDVKYELIYEVCSDSSCSSTLDKLPDDVVFGIHVDSNGKVTDTLINDDNVSIVLLSNNRTDTDYYIKLNLNAGYSWNELALVNQIENYHKDIDFVAYVDGVEQDKFPTSCNYSTSYKTYVNGVETSDSSVVVSCNSVTNTWNLSVNNIPSKVKIWFKSNPSAVEYLSSLSSSDLTVDETGDSNVRYIGSNPSNYVSFNNETWRIIGIFDIYDVDDEGNALSTHSKKLKLIRNDSIGSFSWNSTNSSVNSGWGYNDWNTSVLMNELNGDYLNTSLSSDPYWYDAGSLKKNTKFNRNYVLFADSQELVANVVWNTGAYSSDSAYDAEKLSALEVYNAERGTKVYTGDKINRTATWNGKVALMYYSDYAYASSDSSCWKNLYKEWKSHEPDGETQYFYGNSDCTKNNWLNFVPSGYGTSDRNYYIWWTLTTDSDYSNGVVYLDSRGFNQNWNGSNYAYGIFPTVYLNSNVSFVSGSGTSDDPYVLS